MQKAAGGGGIRLEMSQTLAMKLGKQLQFIVIRQAAGSLLKGPLKPFMQIASALPQNALAEYASGLHKRRVVKQVKRLQRRVGNNTVHSALFPRRRVEVRHRRMQESTLPKGVDAPPVEIVVTAGGPSALWEVQGREVAFRLVRL